jgi:hypothetical protein
MIRVPNKNLPTLLMLHLRVAPQAKIRIAGHQQLAIDRTVRIMAHGASLSQRLVLKHKRARQVPVTLTAILIEPRHRQPACPLEDIRAVRIMALHAVHASFNDRVMLRQVKFSASLEMALQACARIFSRIDDELSHAAATLDMLASGAMA